MVKITYRTLKRFPKTTEDKTNITKTYRNFVTYLKNLKTAKHKLKRDLNRLILEGKQFSILDCGAGEGVAIEQLLESGFGNAHVKKATGISLHAFKNARNLIAKYKKLDWYIEDAFSALPKLETKYDFIVDVWGAYSYVNERIKLLKLYYNALSPGGKAYVYISSKNCIVKNNNHDDHSDSGSDGYLVFSDEFPKKKYIRLEKYLSRRYPDTFYFENHVLVIRKTSVRFPVVDDIEIVDSIYDSSVRTKDKEACIKGNSWYPKTVVFKRKAKSHAQLRNLPLIDTTKYVRPISRVKLNKPEDMTILQSIWSYVKPFIPTLNVFKEIR